MSRGCVFLPIITASRDLDARLLLATELAHRGMRSVIGYNKAVLGEMAAHTSGVGALVTPILVPAAAERIERARFTGLLTIGWDEEGCVYPEPLWYLRNRIDTRALGALDAFVAWGTRSAADMSLAFPDSRIPVLALGNPRIDLLREPAVELFHPEAAGIREATGPFVLVNTNFDLVNHADGEGTLLRRLRASGRISGREDEERFAQWVTLRSAVMDAFVGGLSDLAAALPRHRVLIRPHPSEAVEPWERVARATGRVVVAAPHGSVIPWLLAADVVIHSSCTTAVEAFQLGRPVVAYRPAQAPSSMESALPNDLSYAASSWTELVDAVAAATTGWGGSTAIQEAIADSHVAARKGTLATTRIADLIERSISAVASTTRNSPMAGTPPTAAFRPATHGEVAQRQPPLDAARLSARVTDLAKLLDASATGREGRYPGGSFVVEPID